VREPSGATTPQIGAIAALALAAASTGVIVPALKLLVDRTGHGAVAGGVFTAAHVLGGALGAAYGARALRRIGSARALAAAALAASIIVTLAIAAIDSLELRVALRFVDGACHLLAITTVVAAAASGDAERRARRTVAMGLAIVLGVACGILLGGQLADPQLALIVAALLSGGALIVVLVQLAPDAPAAPRARSGVRGPVAPGLLAFGERFLFGTMSAALPFLAPPSRVSAVFGVFMTASVIALPFARRYAVIWGARRLAVYSAIALGLTLALAGVVDVFSSIPRVMAWAPIGGVAAGALYAAALVLVARSPVLEDRLRDMATLHAGGNAGFAAGALCAGALTSLLPGALVVVVPSIAILTASMIGVWFAVPPQARAAH
jgi:MFS family permease